MKNTKVREYVSMKKVKTALRSIQENTLNEAEKESMFLAIKATMQQYPLTTMPICPRRKIKSAILDACAPRTAQS
jgi:hypothetical protein